MAEKSSKGAEWNKLRLKVLDRDDWTCQYCGKHLIGEDATADHIQPKNKGGQDEMSNLVSACRKCNGEKQDRLLIRTNWFNRRWLNKL